MGAKPGLWAAGQADQNVSQMTKFTSAPQYGKKNK
jgi:hypothetical protein